jgi:septum formation protein
VEFEVAPADVEELEAGDPVEVARENARRKARAVPGDLVLGADTVVALDDRILPKPRDVGQAREWLQALSGRTHRVIGGLCVVAEGEERETVEVTEVTFRSLREREIDWYVAGGEWEGKAGGYAIQERGAALVERVEGEFANVVGLSVQGLLRLLPDLLAP